jgi:hypothetical protein
LTMVLFGTPGLCPAWSFVAPYISKQHGIDVRTDT